MKKILLIVILSIIFLCFLPLVIYSVTLNAENSVYDILLESRVNDTDGYGIKYKESFEIWRFAEFGKGGLTEKKVFP